MNIPQKAILYFKRYPYILILIGIALSWMTINAIQGAEATRKLANEGKFTLAIIKKIKGAKSGRYVEVEFEYSGCKYQVESKNESIPHSSIGEKIFIKFLPSRPSDYDTYEEILVPDSLLNIAPMVWDTLPVKEG